MGMVGACICHSLLKIKALVRGRKGRWNHAAPRRPTTYLTGRAVRIQAQHKKSVDDKGHPAHACTKTGRPPTQHSTSKLSHASPHANSKYHILKRPSRSRQVVDRHNHRDDSKHDGNQTQVATGHVTGDRGLDQVQGQVVDRRLRRARLQGFRLGGDQHLQEAGLHAAGLKWRQTSLRATPHGPPRPTWRHDAPLRSIECRPGRLDASRDASKPARTRPQNAGSRAFNKVSALMFYG